jgi:hypothetical protein
MQQLTGINFIFYFGTVFFVSLVPSPRLSISLISRQISALSATLSSSPSSPLLSTSALLRYLSGPLSDSVEELYLSTALLECSSASSLLPSSERSCQTIPRWSRSRLPLSVSTSSSLLPPGDRALGSLLAKYSPSQSDQEVWVYPPPHVG